MRKQGQGDGIEVQKAGTRLVLAPTACLNSLKSSRRNV